MSSKYIMPSVQYIMPILHAPPQVREALFTKAMYLYNTGEAEAAVTAFKAAEEKTAGVGQKLDITFAILRYAAM